MQAHQHKIPPFFWWSRAARNRIGTTPEVPFQPRKTSGIPPGIVRRGVAGGSSVWETARDWGCYCLMSITASDLLDQTNTAISGLLTSLADTACQEYQLPDGRRVRRAEFATTLAALQQLRTMLNREVALQQRGGKVRLGRVVRR